LSGEGNSAAQWLGYLRIQYSRAAALAFACICVRYHPWLAAGLAFGYLAGFGWFDFLPLYRV
jgi:hypothetical protein